MNFIFVNYEYINQEKLIFSKLRSDFLIKRESLVIKKKVNLVIENIGKVSGVVTSLNPLEIKYNKDEVMNLKSKLNLEIVLAISRPQTVKKVFEYASCFNIKHLHIIACKNSEKSYFSSNIYKDNFLKEFNIKTIEQTGNTNFLQYTLHSKFLDFIKYYKDSSLNLKLNSNINKKAVILDTLVSNTNYDNKEHKNKEFKTDLDYIIAIGPELGWSSKERELFKEHRFESLNLGSSIFRTDQMAKTIISHFYMLNNLK